ncbi:hypothetical protein TRICI_006234 [Trichomonascus ciferrii]|uniref:ATP-dependent RNA helicase n=1 Tax=Trichomonascus ciferrii TaxID=44093 RepID=A0A642ULK1_9ASCO|nr:hypothetical protein TRICI_006234 [Trichomonascus ciferrii]
MLPIFRNVRYSSSGNAKSCIGVWRRTVSMYRDNVGSPSSVKYSSNSGTQNIKLLIDPKKVNEFSQLQLDLPVLSALKKALPEVVKPTKVQKNMLAALKSDLSVVVRSAPGAGKSLATALYVLSSMNPNEISISHLILVPSEHLVEQYYDTITKLLPNDAAVDDIVQRLYRADSPIEQKQLQLLQTHKSPRIVVSTPTRILDMLSSENRTLLPLQNLSCVAIDEADHLLPSEKYLKRSKSSILSPKTSTRPPTDILMAHITAWRATHMRRQNKQLSPLRLILESSTASSYLRKLAPGNNWIQQSPIVKVGLDEAGGIHTNRLPRDVDAYAVSYNPTTKKLRNSELPTLTVEEALLPDSSYGVRHKQKILPPQGERMYDSIDAFARVFNLEQRQRGILVIPPQLSAVMVREQLENRGIRAAYSRLGQDGKNMVYHNSKGRRVELKDPQTIFSKPQREGDPEVLIYDTQKALGLDFPGLSRVYLLTWSAVNNSSRKFLTIAGRCRLCPVHERGEQGRQGSWIPPTGQQRGKVIAIELDDETSEHINHQIALVMTKLDVEVGDYTKSVNI